MGEVTTRLGDLHSGRSLYCCRRYRSHPHRALVLLLKQTPHLIPLLVGPCSVLFSLSTRQFLCMMLMSESGWTDGRARGSYCNAFKAQRTDRHRVQ